MRMIPIGLLSVLAMALVVGPITAPLPAPVEGAFPGVNGKIAFRSDRDINSEIYVMNADGGGQVNLSNNGADDRDPAWSPDGSQIAFDSDRDTLGADIFVMNPDGNDQTNLTNGGGFNDRAAWSPDGTQIAFTSTRDDPDPFKCAACNAEIYVMNADGSGVTRLTNNPAQDISPAWSPDGTQIAFGRSGEIYVMNADGGGQVNLSNNGADDRDPAWSPDGSQIAFDSDRDTLGADIFVMNPDGNDQTNLTNGGGFNDRAAWSPDGTQIAFTSTRDDPDPFKCAACNAEIYVMNADGSGVTRLTNNPASDTSPDWQPLQVSPPTATPISTSPPIPTATVAAAALPATGGTASDGGPTGWLIAALAGAGVAVVVGGAALRRR